MLPGKPHTAPAGGVSMSHAAAHCSPGQQSRHAAPTAQGGMWSPLTPGGKPSARSVRKQMASKCGRLGPNLTPLESLLPPSHPPKSARSARHWRNQTELPPSCVSAASRDDFGDDSAATSVMSTRMAFLTESSLYESSALAVESYQSPLQTRLQRDIAHRSAKMIASLEMGVEQDKLECPPSLLRLRFQEHRFLVDELYQQQDIRQNMEEQYAKQKEELTYCMEKLRDQETSDELEQYVQEVRKLRAYGESLEEDNHLTLQRLEATTANLDKLTQTCDNVLKVAGLEWRDDFEESLMQLQRFRGSFLELESKLSGEQAARKEKSEECRDVKDAHRTLKEQMNTAMVKISHGEAMFQALDEQCREFALSCGLHWHQDANLNVPVLREAWTLHKDLKERHEVLVRKSEELQKTDSAAKARVEQLEAELKAAISEGTTNLAMTAKASDARIAAIEERCAELTAAVQKKADQLSKTEGSLRELKGHCEVVMKAVGKAWEDDPTRFQAQLAEVATQYLDLNQRHIELQAAYSAMEEENSQTSQRENALAAHYEAKASSFAAREDALKSEYKVLAQAHAKLENQWVELREWRLPFAEGEIDGLGQPRNWGVSLQQLVQLHDDISAELEEYCSVHDVYFEKSRWIHVCRNPQCPFQDDHRGAPQKRRIEILDRTLLQPMVPNMYIVVDRYIKPLCLSKGPNVSYSSRMNPDGAPISVFVSHSWSEPFGDLVRTLSVALDPEEVVWMSSVALTQSPRHGVEAIFANCDLGRRPFAFALKHAVKFVAVLDKNLSILGRAWCIYEMEKARRWGIPIQLWGHTVEPLRSVSSCINTIDFRKAAATQPDDLEAVVKAIEKDGGFDTLNDSMRRCIAERAANCETVMTDMEGGLDANNQEELCSLRKKVVEGAQHTNQKAISEVAEMRKQLQIQVEAVQKSNGQEGVEELKHRVRALQLAEAPLLQEQKMLVKLLEDMEAFREDKSKLLIDGVSNKVLGALEPMLEKFMLARRNSGSVVSANETEN